VGPLTGPCVCGSFSAPDCPFGTYVRKFILAQQGINVWHCSKKQKMRFPVYFYFTWQRCLAEKLKYFLTINCERLGSKLWLISYQTNANIFELNSISDLSTVFVIEFFIFFPDIIKEMLQLATRTIFHLRGPYIVEFSRRWGTIYY